MARRTKVRGQRVRYCVGRQFDNGIRVVILRVFARIA